jgi:hypothetical protein
MKNYLFLDIDGVLTSARVHVASQKPGTWAAFDPVAVNFLEKVVDKWPAEIVISSTWRRIYDRYDWEGLFGLSNMTRYFHQNWRTGLDGPKRTHEIAEWLVAHGGPEYNYIILDDEDHSFTEEQKRHWVHTDSENGMTLENYSEILDKTQLRGKL